LMNPIAIFQNAWWLGVGLASITAGGVLVMFVAPERGRT
jgi:hypothetical protein